VQLPVTDVVTFKLISPKQLEKNWRFWLKLPLYFQKGS
jgi:hypothetical protein